MATELFYIWDADGEGSLSSTELCLAFVRIGLSHDHQFAQKILNSISPHVNFSNNDDDIDIRLGDFISIFRSDEISDNVIKKINDEVAFNKRRKLIASTRIQDALKVKFEKSLVN